MKTKGAERDRSEILSFTLIVNFDGRMTIIVEENGTTTK